jgi:phytoene dehydrogenase-like protein
MSSARDVVVIGAGHNGLVAAAYLAKAGLRPLLLESRDTVGGRAVTEEFHQGFRAPGLLHTAGPFLDRVARDLGLAGRGLAWHQPPVRVTALAPDGRALRVYDDAARTAAELREFSEKDARAYPRFAETLARIGAALRPLVGVTPPSLEAPSLRDIWNLAGVGRRVRRLGKRDVHRLLRWGPMAVADFVGEWFESELLRTAVAARGIFASFAGPWSAGTTAGVLMQAALDGHAVAPAAFPRGGMGALTRALAEAARGFGAEIRTGARVERVLVEDGGARGVVLAGGEEIRARAVVSNADPRRTLLGLVDAAVFGPETAGRLRNYRCVGSAAKVNLALSRLPRFAALRANAAAESATDLLGGRIHVGPEIDELELAFDAVKYGEISERPTLDVTIPTLLDPPLAPSGAHVMSIHAQFAPYAPRAGDWSTQKPRLLRKVVDTLSLYAPDLRETIVGEQVLTPLDLETTYGLSGGHLLHGEPALDQLFVCRPLLGWARYRTPVAGLYLCGSGTHPGGPVTGACGASASREILRDLRR